ncbi:MAG: histidinol-phosphate transaminase [Calditrichaeota bacterium]|nr:histidinol-phosphate transaminase [Calditrichota bacterium]MBT7616873.1 histidinol-phosphate transaminase [Calditrichota bacterium]MBT7787554.1 histidinol-phosphate transaminase [Calditrichota bacterium]
MSKFSDMSRMAIRDIIPYEPGKPISEVEREYGLTDVIKLASNENPLGPSPMAMEAVKNAVAEMHLYPDGGGYHLKEKLSRSFDLPPNQIVLGNGSAEIVEQITEAFVGPGDEAIIGRQAFFKYRIAVKIMDGTVVWAEMPGLEYDADDMLNRVTNKTKVIFIANPNNPTGTLMDKGQVDYMMSKLPGHIIVVFDEAYYDYRSPERYPDSMEYLRQGRNVIILRTFSKSYGLAALRLGYAFSTPEISHAMNAVREAFNVNSLALVAGQAALDDHEFLRKTLEINSVGKEYFYKELERIGLVYIPTEANFVLIKTPLPGRDLFKELLFKGVVVRPVDGYGLPDYVRVSIGLPDENIRFFRELEELLRSKDQI